MRHYLCRPWKPIGPYVHGKIINSLDYDVPLSHSQGGAVTSLLRSTHIAPHGLLCISHQTEAGLQDHDIPVWAPRWTNVEDAGVRPQL